MSEISVISYTCCLKSNTQDCVSSRMKTVPFAINTVENWNKMMKELVDSCPDVIEDSIVIDFIKTIKSETEKTQDTQEWRTFYSNGWNDFGFKFTENLIDKFRNTYGWSDSEIFDLIRSLGCTSYIRDNELKEGS